MSNIEAASLIVDLYARHGYYTQEYAKAVAMACHALIEHYDYEEPDEVKDDD